MKKIPIIIISGPTGVGKSTVRKHLAEIMPEVEPVIAFTTRPKRPKEINEKDYVFVSKDTFSTLVEMGNFEEMEEVYDNWYGITKGSIELIKINKKIPLLVINPAGKRTVENTFSRVISFYLLPESWDTLKERLRKRGDKDKDILQKRLKRDIEDLKFREEYTYRYINKESQSTAEYIAQKVKECKNILHK